MRTITFRTDTFVVWFSTIVLLVSVVIVAATPFHISDTTRDDILCTSGLSIQSDSGFCTERTESSVRIIDHPAFWENKPASPVGKVLYKEGKYYFYWSDRPGERIVLRTGTDPTALSRPTTIADGLDGTPKFSMALENGTFHLVQGTHYADSLHYRSSSDGVDWRDEGIILRLNNLPEKYQEGFFRSTLTRHDGRWYLWVAVLNTDDHSRDTVLYTGDAIRALSYEGIALDGSEHDLLAANAVFGGIWYDQTDGTFYGYVDGSNVTHGTHAHVFLGTSADGLNWTVGDRPMLNRTDFDVGDFPTEHLYAPSGVWVDGRYVAIAPGSNTNAAPGEDPYDHDTSLLITDDRMIEKTDYWPNVTASS